MSSSNHSPPAVPVAPLAQTSWPQPFLGRGPALGLLTGAWDQARAGPGRLVLVAGEAGAGKTRLVAEFGRRAHDDGAAVLAGSCDDDLALPYQPWVEVVRHLVSAAPDAIDPGVLAPIGQLITAPGEPGPDADRLRVYTAFGRAVGCAAQRWPTVLVLEDLHWAGSQTLALLRHLVRTGLPRGLLVVATFRDPAADAALAACLADLHRHPVVTRLRLTGLDEATVRAFVAAVLGHELDGPLLSVATDMWSRSGGNPFYLNEIWRHIQGVLTRDGDRWVVGDTAAVHAVPDSVRDVVAARLRTLSPTARRLAEVAALGGQDVGIDVVATAAGIDDIRVPLDELVACGLLTAIPAAGSVYRFDHAIVRDTVAAGVSPLTRRSIHRALGQAIEAHHVHDRSPFVAELARHAVAAGPLVPADAVVRYARGAAAQAASAAAHDEAAAHLASVLDRDLTEPVRARLLTELAECQFRGGHYRSSRDNSRQAFTLAEHTGEPGLAAEAALLFEQATHYPGLPGAPAVDMLGRAIELNSTPDQGPGDAAIAARLHASLGRAMAIDGRPEAIGVVERSVTAARDCGDTQAVGIGLQAIITASRDPRRVLAAAHELERLGAAHGDVWNQAYGCLNQCRAKVALGDLTGADIDVARLTGLNEVGRGSLFVHGALHIRVILALAAGDLAGAESYAEQAAELDPGDAAGDGVYGVQLFAIRRAQGRLPEVLPAARALGALGSRGGIWRPGLAALYAEIGMLDDAAAVFGELARDDFAAVPRDALWPACLTYLAETCIALSDETAARPLADALAPMRGTNVMAAFTMCFGPADRLIGALRAVAGDHAGADESFSSAMDLALRSRSPLWEAEVCFDWAAALPESRAALRARGESIAATIGMGWRRSAPPPTPAGLTDRETQVLRLVARGLSNRQIARELVISQHTVANHVRAVLRKTGSANRTQAGAYAHRHRL